MSAAKLDITIEQGALFEMLVTVNDNQTTPQAIDLTGFTFEGQIRKAQDDKTASATFNFDIKDQTQLATKGQVRIFIPSAQTALIPVKSSTAGFRATADFLYDISYGLAGGEKYRLLQGKATVIGEVTRE